MRKFLIVAALFGTLAGWGTTLPACLGISGHR